MGQRYATTRRRGFIIIGNSNRKDFNHFGFGRRGKGIDDARERRWGSGERDVDGDVRVVVVARDGDAGVRGG